MSTIFCRRKKTWSEAGLLLNQAECFGGKMRLFIREDEIPVTSSGEFFCVKKSFKKLDLTCKAKRFSCRERERARRHIIRMTTLVIARDFMAIACQSHTMNNASKKKRRDKKIPLIFHSGPRVRADTKRNLFFPLCFHATSKYSRWRTRMKGILTDRSRVARRSRW